MHHIALHKKKNMKKLSLIISVMTVLFGQVSVAQVKVAYLERLKVTKQMEPQMVNPKVARIVKDKLKQMDRNSILYYNDGQSLYEPEKKKEEQTEHVIVQSMGGIGCVYKDFKSQEIMTQEYILDRQFLIVEKMPVVTWILDKETKKIGKFDCHKAHTEKGETAWYCPEIKMPDGPSIYSGLPGLILAVELEGKEYMMQSIDFNYSNGRIEKPTKGKKISRNDFIKLKDKKMKEMNITSGGSVKVIKM